MIRPLDARHHRQSTGTSCQPVGAKNLAVEPDHCLSPGLYGGVRGSISDNIGSYSAGWPAARHCNRARSSNGVIPRKRANVSARLSFSPRTNPIRASPSAICSATDGPEGDGAEGGNLFSSLCSLLRIVFMSSGLRDTAEQPSRAARRQQARHFRLAALRRSEW